mmetsp:Transcript_51180/g.75947  ORF Transcript_51180/g.75947 Transcript_51180/m.75947 type:complete len:410 (+) Transcript_51180:79-1308(+)
MLSQFSSVSFARNSSNHKTKIMPGSEIPQPVGKIDSVGASDLLSQVIRDNNVLLGGSSMGMGFRTAARYYLTSHFARQTPEYFNQEGALDLNPDLFKIKPVEDSFYVLDLGVVISQLYQWRKHLPRVEVFYAVKCNPDPIIIRSLAILGANFDCASRTEIQLVEEATTGLSGKPEIIYANPCKARAHLIEAVCRGVKMVTFDNEAEIAKCAAVSKKIQLVLRIVTDDRGSQCRLSSKFGAHRNKWRALLAEAKKHDLEVIGVSFHVGSGCRDASRYELALKDAREIFDFAKKEYGFKMTLLDIGGGFPGETHSIWNPARAGLDDVEDDESDEGLDIVKKPEDEESSENHFMYFNDIAAQVSPMLDSLFPKNSGVRIIAEPGRYFVAAAATLVASVIGARDNVTDDTTKP